MTELTRFRPRLAQRQYPSFNFERASVALLASYKPVRHSAHPDLPLRSEWRDPVAVTAVLSQAAAGGTTWA
jgi:hypothetical protein